MATNGTPGTTAGVSRHTGRTHGLRSTYLDLACRCQPCTDANRRYQATYRAAAKLRAAADPSLVTHGTDSGYSNWGCRCPACVAAHTETKRAWRAAMSP